jgi:hypothetical protein
VLLIAPAHPALQARAVKAPAPVAPELDELTPLTRVTPRTKNPTRAARHEIAAPVVEATPAPVPATAPVAETKSATADFNFLDGAEAPRSELKRPSSEL